MPAQATPAEFAAYLIHGFHEETGEVPHFFDVSNGPITVDLTPLNAQGRQLARWAMETWEGVADISFKVTGTGAMLTFDDESNSATAAYEYQPDGTLNRALIDISSGWVERYGAGLDSYAFRTYVHEIGHVLGLGHAGPYNLSATFPDDLRFDNDSWQMTVMSYFSQGENTNVDAGQASSVTLMPADIIAIQELYGSSTRNPAQGDTVWGVDSTLQGGLGDMFRALTDGGAAFGGDPFTFVVYDPDGEDTIDFSHSAAAQRVDLSPGAISDVNGTVGSMIIEEASWIENYVAGSGNDWVRGTGHANVIEGRDGADELIGMNGADELHGGAGKDVLVGNNGQDMLYGGADDDRITGAVGNDTMWGGDGNDTISGLGGHDIAHGDAGNDRLEGGGGEDFLDGGAGEDTLLGGNRDDTLLGGGGNDALSGHAGHDSLYGEAGDDLLIGMGGNDWIDGGAGDDVLTGGNRLDSFVYNGGNDRITDFNTRQDSLILDAVLWGGGARSEADLRAMAQVDSQGVTFDFGGGNTLLVEGLDRVSQIDDLQIA